MKDFGAGLGFYPWESSTKVRRVLGWDVDECRNESHLEVLKRAKLYREAFWTSGAG